MLKAIRLAAEAAFVAVAGLLVVGPTVVLLHGPWEPWRAEGGGLAWGVFSSPGTRTILARTLFLAGLVTVGTVAIAVLLAVLLRRVPGRRLIWVLPLLSGPLLADQLARNYGWYFLLRTDGVLNRTLLALGATDTHVIWLYRLQTVAAAMVQGLFPLATLPLLLAGRFVDPAVVVAARTFGARRWQLLRRAD